MNSIIKIQLLIEEHGIIFGCKSQEIFEESSTYKRPVPFKLIWKLIPSMFGNKIMPCFERSFCILNVYMQWYYFYARCNWGTWSSFMHIIFLWRKALLWLVNIVFIYSMYFYCGLIVLFVNITLFYIECVLLDATSTTSVEVAPTVNGSFLNSILLMSTPEGTVLL